MDRPMSGSRLRRDDPFMCDAKYSSISSAHSDSTTHTHDQEETMHPNNRTNELLAALPRPRIIVAAAAVAALAATILVLHPAATHAAPAEGAAISTTNTSLGRIIVTSNGRTLYLFEKDRNGKSACSGQCAVFWPPLITSGKPRVTGGAKASLIGTMRRADGRLQVTYNHHPLYTFVKDKKAGQTNGEGVNAFGAGWDAMSPAGAKVEPKPAKPASSGIPQNNGGDQDSDNNGGPSDGDGNL
jgi:predicted lipoprotein with Yx(FWY)xxD motif